MAVLAAFMVPHPPMIVPAVGKGSESQIAATVRAYQQVAGEIAALEPETIVVTKQMMNAFAVIVFFQCIQTVMTKGVLRGGGDTRFLMVADILFMWVISIPLGYVAGILLKWPAWSVQLCLRADYAIKAVWCIGRLMSRKWIHDVAGRK